jgi:hypothetical protein
MCGNLRILQFVGTWDWICGLMLCFNVIKDLLSILYWECFRVCVLTGRRRRYQIWKGSCCL